MVSKLAGTFNAYNNFKGHLVYLDKDKNKTKQNKTKIKTKAKAKAKTKQNKTKPLHFPPPKKNHTKREKLHYAEEGALERQSSYQYFSFGL